MAQDKERLQQMKDKLRKMEVELENNKNLLLEYQQVGSKADAKIEALNKIHSQKSKALMNSITLLKKENRALEKANSGGAQSQLIGKLNKDIAEQEVVINILRQIMANKDVQDDFVDEQIIKALNKGPPQLKAPSREEMKIEISNLKKKLNTKGKGGNGSQVVSQNQSQVSQNAAAQDLDESKSVISEDNKSIISQDDYNSVQTLITRIEVLKNENEELKLHLKADQEIIDKFEDQLEEKGQEINDLRAAKTEYMVQVKKYEALQETIEQDRQRKNDENIGNNDIQLKVERLEIETQKQLQQIRDQQELMEVERDNAKAKQEDLERRNRDLTLDISSLQTRYNDKASQYVRLEREMQSQKTNLEKQLYQKTISEEQFKKDLERTQIIKEKLENQLAQREKQVEQTNEQIEKIRNKLEQTQRELDEAREKGAQLASIGNLGLITGGGGGAYGKQDPSDLRKRIKDMTKREIDLQDKIEQLQGEVQFLEQKEKANRLIKTKQFGSTVEENELKKKYQREIQQRYEAKVRKLVLEIKTLEQQNQEYKQIYDMMQSNAEIMESDLSSGISINLSALEDIQGTDIENMSDIQELTKSQDLLLKKDQNAMKKKLIELQQRNVDYQQKIDQLQLEKSQLQPTQKKSDEDYEKKISKMQRDYDKLINNLSQKIADLKYKEVRLSQMDSNISSVVSQKSYYEKELQDMDSNIDFSLQDIQKSEVNISQVSSNLDSVLSSQKDGISVRGGQQKGGQDFNDISSRISDISGLSDVKLKKKI